MAVLRVSHVVEPSGICWSLCLVLVYNVESVLTMPCIQYMFHAPCNSHL